MQPASQQAVPHLHIQEVPEGPLKATLLLSHEVQAEPLNLEQHSTPQHTTYYLVGLDAFCLVLYISYQVQLHLHRSGCMADSQVHGWKGVQSPL